MKISQPSAPNFIAFAAEMSWFYNWTEQNEWYTNALDVGAMDSDLHS